LNQTVAKGNVVTLTYHVEDTQGNQVDEGAEPLVYLHGTPNALFPKLQAALEGLAIGATATVTLEPSDAFGEYDADLVEIESRDRLPANIAVGMYLEGAPEGEEPLMYTVTEVEGDKVVLDGNHPLAGLALVFTCTVADLRAATAEELAEASA
jgi:FKBP-type peptidyl-prolyl cis-trans isomerase SlyD